MFVVLSHIHFSTAASLLVVHSDFVDSFSFFPWPIIKRRNIYSNQCENVCARDIESMWWISVFFASLFAPFMLLVCTTNKRNANSARLEQTLHKFEKHAEKKRERSTKHKKYMTEKKLHPKQHPKLIFLYYFSFASKQIKIVFLFFFKTYQHNLWSWNKFRNGSPSRESKEKEYFSKWHDWCHSLPIQWGGCHSAARRWQNMNGFCLHHNWWEFFFRL